MTEDFNKWWDESPVNPNNPYTQNTPAYWAWEGWCAAVKAEREACAKVCEAEADDGTEGEWDTCCLSLARRIRERGQA